MSIEETRAIRLMPNPLVTKFNGRSIDDFDGEGQLRENDDGGIGLTNALELPPDRIEVELNIPETIGRAEGRIGDDAIDGGSGDSFHAFDAVFVKNHIEQIKITHFEGD